MTDYNDFESQVEDFDITPPAMASFLLSAYEYFKRAKIRITRVKFGPLAADPRRRNIQIAALRDAIRTYPRSVVRVSYSTYTCASPDSYYVYAIMQFTRVPDQVVQIYRAECHKEEMAVVLTGADKFETDSSRTPPQIDEDDSFEYAAVLYCIFAVPSLYARVKDEFTSPRTRNRGRVLPVDKAALKGHHPGIDDCCTLFCDYFTKLCGRAPTTPHDVTYDPSCGSFIFDSTRISDETACVVDYLAKFENNNPSLLQYVTTHTCDNCNAVTDKKITTDYGIDIDKNTGQNSIDVLIRTCFAEDKTEAKCDTCNAETMQTSEFHINRPPGVLLVQNTGGSTVAEFEFVNLAHGAQHAKYRACVVVCKDEDGATSVHRRVPHTDTWELRRPGCSALVTSPNCVDRYQISFLLYEQTSTVAEDNYARNMFLASGV
jgi:hypothetical protein